MSVLDPDRRRVLAVLRRHGWNATSFQVLEPGFRYWFADDDACVAYGAPLTDAHRLREVGEQFHRHALASGRRTAFFGVEQRVVDALPWRALLVREQPEWDARRWPEALRGSSSLREQVRRARAKGVTVRTASHDELVSSSAPLRRALEALVAAWLARHEMAPMGSRSTASTWRNSPGAGSSESTGNRPTPGGTRMTQRPRCPWSGPAARARPCRGRRGWSPGR